MGSNLERWFSDEPRGFKSVMECALVLSLIAVSVDYIFGVALENWGIISRSELPQVGDFPYRHYNWMNYTDMFLLSPLKEELVFRVFPLAATMTFISRSMGVIMGTLVMSAALFGSVHPYPLEGNIQVAIVGMFFGFVFLKCGGYNQRYYKAAAAATIAHGSCNLLVFLQEWWFYFTFAR